MRFDLPMKPVFIQNILFGALAVLVICGAFILPSLHIENETQWGLLIIIILGGSTGIIMLLYANYKKKAQFANRELLTIDEIYNRFYSDSDLSKDTIIDLWQNVAEILSIPPGKLRPSDRFGVELGPYRIIDDELNELQAITLHKLKGSGASVNLSMINTLDDYIRLIGRIEPST